MPTFTPLQSMSKASGAVLAQCLARGAPTSTLADKFDCKIRAVCTDSGAYNRVGEELICGQRRGAWPLALFPCDVHGVASVHQKSFEQLMMGDVQGMIRLSLSLRFQNAMLTFRSALREEIRERGLTLRKGQCPQQAVLHKQRVLQLFFERSHSGLTSLVILLRTFSGDWRKQHTIEIYYDARRAARP